MLQDDAGHAAEGVPHVEGSTEVELFETSEGMVDLLRQFGMSCQHYTSNFVSATRHSRSRTRCCAYPGSAPLGVTRAQANSQNARFIELRCPHPATRVVEPVSEAVGLCLRHRAPSARVQARRAVRAPGIAELRDAVGLRASRVRVEHHLVVRDEVDFLQDVNLASVRPIRGARPERGPHGASEG